MGRLLHRVLAPLMDAHRKRAQARLLSELDERTLRDIGLEHEANSARVRERDARLRFDSY